MRRLQRIKCEETVRHPVLDLRSWKCLRLAELEMLVPPQPRRRGRGWGEVEKKLDAWACSGEQKCGLEVNIWEGRFIAGI